MEEQACLVRARSDSENSSKLSFGSITRAMAYTEDRLPVAEGAGEPGNAANVPSPPERDGENGELLDYNDSSVLEQFHEDALRQSGCGLSQARVLVACGLAIGGAVMELSAIPFILPSAEIELCILTHEKSWLVLISLVGASLGSVGWGVLSERLGRRRVLLSCLAVNAVFAAVAAFMPTYGTFMMARFCSAIGSGGIVPTCYTYATEFISRSKRWRGMPVLHAASAVGSLAAAALASAVLPPTGATTLIENREHFSAWHRYLLLCTLPILASLVSLIWTQESPRYLIEVGREVDAMGVYQSIHSGNQIRICGKADVASSDPEYRLGELSLPGKRRPPALHHVRHSVKLFWQTFFQLFSNPYRRLTVSLGGVMLFTIAIQFSLATYVPATVEKTENELFEASKQIKQGAVYEQKYYNETLDNIEFVNATFSECTFKDMLMLRVVFANCSFYSVSFSNVKTSLTNFKGCLFVNTTIIDTDMDVGRELDEWCVLNGSVIRGMRGGCGRHADLASSIGGLVREQTFCAHAALLATLLATLTHSMRPTLILCGASIMLTPTLYLAHGDVALYIYEAAFRVIISLIYYGVSVHVVESYPSNLRCTAHGIIMSVSYMGAAVFRSIAYTNALTTCIICFLFAVASAAFASRIK